MRGLGLRAALLLVDLVFDLLLFGGIFIGLDDHAVIRVIELHFESLSAFQPLCSSAFQSLFSSAIW